jgi:hypothetical protein
MSRICFQQLLASAYCVNVAFMMAESFSLSVSLTRSSSVA